MYLSQVRIKNFKGITEEEIKFVKGFNLIKGINGRGKTSILEAIAVGMGGYVAGVPDVASRHISINEIRKEYKMTGDGSCECLYHVPVEVEMTAQINGMKQQWLRARTSISSSRSTIQPRDIVKIAEKMSVEEDSELPVLIYEAAGRVWAQKRQKNENPFGKKITRSIGYIDSLVEASNIKMLRNWCIKMEMIAFKQKKQIEEYEAVKAAVARFIQGINGDGRNYSVFYDSQLEEIMFQADDEILPITDLSAGYQSLIWMVFDIAYRMALLNPKKASMIAESSGVVLIDEIDMHLHPKWQWNIISALQNVFPNIQFIATTHAPILFVASKNVRIIDIDGEEIEYFDSHYGIDINESVNEFQQTEEISPHIKPLKERINDLIDIESFDEANELIKELEKILGNEHPLVTKFKTILDLEMIAWEDEE